MAWPILAHRHSFYFLLQQPYALHQVLEVGIMPLSTAWVESTSSLAHRPVIHMFMIKSYLKRLPTSELAKFYIDGYLFPAEVVDLG